MFVQINFKKILVFVFFLFYSHIISAEEIFLSLKKNKVNVRYSPSFQSPIKYIYKKINLPIKQIDKKENWRRIIDLKNNSGWIHRSQLMPTNSIITLKDKILFTRPTNLSKPLAKIKKGRVLIVQNCEFDWCKIKLPQLIKIYKNDFNNYHLIECNKYSKNHNSYILKNKYCIFAHELIKNNIIEENNQIEINNQIEMFKIKLLERINRIKNIKNPVFVRIETYNYRSKEIYTNYWKQLLLLLDNYYISYLIILISKFNPKLNNIRWYSHNKFDKDWKNENIDWFNIFVNN